MQTIVFVKFLVYNIYTLFGGDTMAISYKKLFKLLIDRNMKKKDLQQMAQISPASVSKMAKNEYVSMEVIVKVCTALNVDIGDIVEDALSIPGIRKQQLTLEDILAVDAESRRRAEALAQRLSRR